MYAVAGEINVDGTVVPPQHLAILEPGATAVITAASGARALAFGGAKLDGERHLWWNFVASSTDRIEAAKAEWRGYAHGGVPQGSARFRLVPDETEWIPLPDR